MKKICFAVQIDDKATLEKIEHVDEPNTQSSPKDDDVACIFKEPKKAIIKHENEAKGMLTLYPVSKIVYLSDFNKFVIFDMNGYKQSELILSAPTYLRINEVQDMYYIEITEYDPEQEDVKYRITADDNSIMVKCRLSMVSREITLLKMDFTMTALAACNKILETIKSLVNNYAAIALSGDDCYISYGNDILKVLAIGNNSIKCKEYDVFTGKEGASVLLPLDKISSTDVVFSQRDILLKEDAPIVNAIMDNDYINTELFGESKWDREDSKLIQLMKFISSYMNTISCIEGDPDEEELRFINENATKIESDFNEIVSDFDEMNIEHSSHIIIYDRNNLYDFCIDEYSSYIVQLLNEVSTMKIADAIVNTK